MPHNAKCEILLMNVQSRVDLQQTYQDSVCDVKHTALDNSSSEGTEKESKHLLPAMQRDAQLLKAK